MGGGGDGREMGKACHMRDWIARTWTTLDVGIGGFWAKGIVIEWGESDAGRGCIIFWEEKRTRFGEGGGGIWGCRVYSRKCWGGKREGPGGGLHRFVGGEKHGFGGGGGVMVL